MGFDTKHPEYIRTAAEWRMMDDALGGEADVKRRGTDYLPMTAGMANAKAADGIDVSELYKAYLIRSQYPEWVRDAVRSMMGMVARMKPETTLDFGRLKSMAHEATADGYPLQQLFLRTVQAVIKKGRFGLLADVDAAGKPFVAAYEAEAVVNWKVSAAGGARSDLSLLVLKEAVPADGDVFSHETRDEYLVYRMADGVCTVARLDGKGATLWERPLLDGGGRPLDFIPFVFCGATDNAPDVDVLPLSTMMKSALQYYRLSADYFQELHLTAHPQPVITGQALETANMVTGPMLAWVLPEAGAGAFYLEISGTGIEAKRVAMEAQKNAALEAGARVMDMGGSESGAARQARQNDQYATLRSIVKNSAEAVEQCLRYLGVWFGLSAAEADAALKFSVDLDFEKTLDTSVLQQLFSAAQMGMVSPETVWDYLQTGKIPERSWDDEQGRILAAGLNDGGH
nr:MAG TPA: portal [Caudoviricetes sp.]